MKLSAKQGVTKMAHYINYLAAKASRASDALHVKQARVNRLAKLSAALGRHNLLGAIKVAYPEMNESQRMKTATYLIGGLAGKMRKAAAVHKKRAMAMSPAGGGAMGAAGGVAGAVGGGMGGGDGGMGPGTAGSSPMGMGTTQPQGTGGAGIQTAPSYSASGAPTQIANRA